MNDRGASLRGRRAGRDCRDLGRRTHPFEPDGLEPRRGGSPLRWGRPAPQFPATSWPSPQACSPAKIPDRLPEFSLEDLRGKPTPIDTWSGKSLVINFWATWCAPCRREIPLLEDIIQCIGRIGASGRRNRRGSSRCGDELCARAPDRVSHFDRGAGRARRGRCVRLDRRCFPLRSSPTVAARSSRSTWVSCTGPRPISFSPWSKTSIRTPRAHRWPAAPSPKVSARSRPATPG